MLNHLKFITVITTARSFCGSSRHKSMSSNKDKAKRKLVIDTDAGLDDAHAILLALAHRDDVDVVAITMTGGNSGLDNVTTNVLRTLNVAGRTDVRKHLHSSAVVERYCKVFLFGRYIV